MYENIFDLIQDLPTNKADRLYGAEQGGGLVKLSQVESVTETLQTSSWACKAVFQSLSSISKNILMRLLFSDSDINLSELLVWIQGDNKAAILQSCFNELKQLHIVTDIEFSTINTSIDSTTGTSTTVSSSSTFKLNPYFKRNLIQAITQPEQPWQSSLALLQPDKKPPKISELDEFSDIKWENVLRTLVGAELLDDSQLRINSDLAAVSSEMNLKIKEFTLNTTRHFLTSASLATEGPPISTGRSAVSVPSLQITAKGYEYMLQDRLSQVWSFVSAMLSRVRDTQTHEEEILSLLFTLSFCRLGQSYPVAALSKVQRQVIDKLWLVGVIYLRNLKSSRFYPTRTIINLLSCRPRRALGSPSSSIATSGSKRGFSSLSALPEDITVNMNMNMTVDEKDDTPFDGGFSSSGNDRHQQKSLQLVVETNDQVVGYTSSDLDIAMLGLFVDIRLRLPNMVFGKITREKVKAAYRAGIKSSQIINFLTIHAHPIVLERVLSSQQVKNKRLASEISSSGGNKSNDPQSSFITDFEYTIVPNNVIDQLLLWEAESFRVQTQDAVVFPLAEMSGFTIAHYKRTVEYLIRLRCLLWEREAVRMVAVSPEGVELLQSFVHETLGL